ncbi:conserved hypothetical protein [Paraburkholderia sacchari]|uniref:hypothetical protein n=1 Tax=Paraburkholderia sacchari TaxID=159450 RepID=UPI0039A5B845
MRERWGTFSVKDHKTDAPFVSDVLLYDRLVIPVPAGTKGEAWWNAQGWEPQGLRDCLDILGVKTDETEGLALTVPWDESKRNRFKSRMSTAAAFASQQRDADCPYYMDPFEMTSLLLRDEFRPALPKGVSKAWTVAAYNSLDSLEEDLSQRIDDRGARLAMTLRHHFFTPTGSDPKHEMLKRAVDLSNQDKFRNRRARFYEWQEEIIEEQISEEKAIEELDQRLAQYNDALKGAFRESVAKFAFTVIPIILGVTGAILEPNHTGVAIAAASGMVEMTRFVTFERKPEVAKGDLDAAAMAYDARKVLRVR